jgi:5-methylcytosine-specific restriction endonuclease McrA
VHEKRRDHKCPHCGDTFGKASNLTDHIKSFH